MEDSFSSRSLQIKLDKAFKILRTYSWLVDAYVLDFYVEDHWSKLTETWRRHLRDMSPEELVFLLDPDEKSTRHVWPLALLTLRKLFEDINISRKLESQDSLPRNPLLEHPKLRNLFTKCVKPKKRHEVRNMAAFCKRSIDHTSVDFVVDFGAGLGHLARVLGYAYSVKVCCFDMDDSLNTLARELDLQLEAMASKYLSVEECNQFCRPAHLTIRLTTDTQQENILNAICKALGLTTMNFTFGIIGLHPCGDLGPILMRMFLNCEQALFINFVGCCYMKLSTKEAQSDCVSPGFPMSRYLKQFPRRYCSELTYSAREISCHAIETYCQRLSTRKYENLKVHSFRAAAERILIKYWPNLKHCGLRNVKHNPGMTFEDYFYKAVQSLPVGALPKAALQTTSTESDLRHWKQIVIFYTLRLFFAPLIESILLYDRMLFLKENGRSSFIYLTPLQPRKLFAIKLQMRGNGGGFRWFPQMVFIYEVFILDCSVAIKAIFDPYLSPRNHVTSAVKKNV